MKDVKMWKQKRTGKNFPAGFLKIFFVFGKKRACPPIEKGGGRFDTATTNPEHTWKGQR